MCFAPQWRAIFGQQTSKKWPVPLIFSTFWLTNMLRATAACHFWTSELPKWLLHPQFFNILTSKCASRHSRVAFWNIGTSKMALTPSVFNILTSKCASRHSRVAFWNIWTSKMAPGMWCFAHFDFQTCFSPQPRAIFLLSAEQLPPHPPL